MKTVAVIFGGQSTEHDVSIITALSSIIRPLQLTKKYQIIPVYIAKDGTWYADERLADVALYSSGKVNELLQKLPAVRLTIDKGLTFSWPARFGTPKNQKIDLVFPAMHGTHGEDGELMGLLEMAGVPYVGCGPAASAIAMDKVLAKQVTQSDGIASTPWIWCSRADVQSDIESVLENCSTLEYPLFVKPAHLGSSIGITRVKNDDELRNALELAAHYDTKIIIEHAVQNLVEVTLPVLGNDVLRPALLEEPLQSGEDFFNFDTKYMHGGGKKGGAKTGKGAAGAQGYSKIPAELPKALYDNAIEVGLAAYRSIGCSGTARVDMLIDFKTQKVYFNEVNPLPGSLYAHNWRQAGLSGVELVEELIRLAEESWQAKQSTATTFQTNFLKQF